MVILRLTMVDSLNLEGLTFVVADGAANFRKIAAGILRDFGAGTILEAKDGESVLEILSRSQIDMVLCDTALPGLNGFALTRKLRGEENPHRYIPIVLLTSHTRQGNVERARDCGGNVVVAKPLSPRSLYSRLHWAAENERGFIESANYCGPDRRFKSEGPPAEGGRRAEDSKDGDSANETSGAKV